MKKLNSRSIRNAVIIKGAVEAKPLTKIADELGVTINTVERAVFSDEGQAALRECLDTIESSINVQLPELLGLSIDNLKQILSFDSYASNSDRIKAAQTILTTSLKLSEISNRAKSA